MANTDIKWFSFDNTNAPQLNNTWGCMIDVLDACLVTGYGSQPILSITITNGVGVAVFGGIHKIKQFQVVAFSGASVDGINSEFKVLGLTHNSIEFLVDLPDQEITGAISCKIAALGWSKVFSGAQKAVYQAKDTVKNPYFLRVDNSQDPVYNSNYAKFAKVGILETCSGIDDLSGNQAPYDISNPNKNWIGTGSNSGAIAGWYKWQYAISEWAAYNAAYGESNDVSNGDRAWTIIGINDSFYLINSATVGNTMCIPYAFGVYNYNNNEMPFLIAVNRHSPASSQLRATTTLSDANLLEIAGLYNAAGLPANTKFSKLVAGLGVVSSGVATNNVKLNGVSGFTLSPYHVVDSENYILNALPLVQCCVNDATKFEDRSLAQDADGNVYLSCVYRVKQAGVQGVLFFKVYEGNDA